MKTPPRKTLQGVTQSASLRKKSTAGMLTRACPKPRQALQFRAQMAELVDAPASGAGVLMDV
ncbi:MAG: hypothetical protein AAFR27_09085, partial [Pseudomonadota bacterium]